MAYALRELRTDDEENLFHLLAKGNLRDRKRAFKKELTQEEYAVLKRVTEAHKASNTALAVELLKMQGVDINCYDCKKNTPLDILWKKLNKRTAFVCENIEKESVLYHMVAAMLQAGAHASPVVLENMVLSTFDLLMYSRKRRGKKHWELSKDEVERSTLLKLFQMCDRQMITDIAICLINSMNPSDTLLVWHYFHDREPKKKDQIKQPTSLLQDPRLTIILLNYFMQIVNTNVYKGDVLLHLLQSLFKRFESDTDFADELLFGRQGEDPVDSGVGLALVELTAALAGGDGCESLRQQSLSNGTTPLHLSCLMGLTQVVHYYVQHPMITVNARDNRNNTPLMSVLYEMRHCKVWFTRRMAIYLEIAKELANDERHDFTTEDLFGMTPFMLCLEIMSSMGLHYRDKAQYYKVLQFSKLDTTSQIHRGQTAAMMCVVENRLGALLDIISTSGSGKNLLAQDYQGRTALHHAGLHARVECVEILLAKAKDLCKLEDKQGNVALYYIVEHFPPTDALEVVRKHCRHWQFGHRNYINQTVLEYYEAKVAKGARSTDLLSALNHAMMAPQFYQPKDSIQEETVNEGTGLFRGSNRKKFGSLPNVFHKSTAAVDVTTKKPNHNPAGDTLSKPLVAHIKDLEKLTTLTKIIAEKSGAAINSQKSNGHTAAMFCSCEGLAEELRIVLDLEPDLNVVDEEDRTALHLAALDNQAECLRILLNDETGNLDLNLQDRLGNTAIFYIVEKFAPEETVKLLGNHSWKFDTANNFDQTAYDYYCAHVPSAHIHDDLVKVLARRCVKGFARPAPVKLKSTSPDNHRLSAAIGQYHVTDDGSLKTGRWKKILRDQRAFFIDNFDIDPRFFDLMVQEGVLDDHQAETLKSQTPFKAGGDLITLLGKRGDRAFKVLIVALRITDQNVIADRIEQALIGESF